jgi:putative transposase
MKGSRFDEEQIIAILREQEAGATTADVCRKHGVSSATFYKWKSKYGGLEVSDARRLKILEDENRKLKNLLAEAMLDNAMLKDLNAKKMVTPAVKRQAVVHLCQAYEVSQRRACQVISTDRASMRYRSARPDDAALRARLCELAAVRRRFAYRRLLVLLRREGTRVNHKKLRRLYREEHLQVRRRGGRKRALGTRAPLALPQGPNQRWSLDFLSDTLTDSRRAGRSRARCHHRPARQAVIDRQRQRYGADQHGDPGMVTRDSDRVALYRTRQTDPERLHRKLQRAAS